VRLLLPGSAPSDEDIAARLGISPRKLRRLYKRELRGGAARRQGLAEQHVALVMEQYGFDFNFSGEIC
jgi:AraC-like DNA-binding protein